MERGVVTGPLILTLGFVPGGRVRVGIGGNRQDWVSNTGRGCLSSSVPCLVWFDDDSPGKLEKEKMLWPSRNRQRSRKSESHRVSKLSSRFSVNLDFTWLTLGNTVASFVPWTLEACPKWPRRLSLHTCEDG